MVEKISRYPVAIVAPTNSRNEVPVQITTNLVKAPPAVHVRHLRTGIAFPFLLSQMEGQDVQDYELKIYPPQLFQGEPYFEILISDGKAAIQELPPLRERVQTERFENLVIKDLPAYLKGLHSSRFADVIVAYDIHDPWPDPTSLSLEVFTDIETP